jgi:two-component system response regulator RegA
VVLATPLLIVDDEVAYADALAHFLRHEGFSVSTAYSMAGARDALRARPPRLVVLDVRLPDGSGLDLLAELPVPRPAVIVLTGFGDVPLAVDAMQRGATDFLTKPVELPVLSTAVRRALERVTARTSGPSSLDAVERAHIADVLLAHGGNRTHTARALGISRATLIKKIREYGLDVTHDAS